MITAFVFGWAVATTTIIVWGVLRIRKQKPVVPVVEKKETDILDFQEIIKNAFKAKGIDAKMVEIPEIDVGIARSDIAKLETVLVAWLTSIRDKVDINKRDMDAMLQVCRALAINVLDIQKSLEQPAQRERNQSAFINELRYVGERFAKTPTQKKVIESIISNVRETYGNSK